MWSLSKVRFFIEYLRLVTASKVIGSAEPCINKMDKIYSEKLTDIKVNTGLATQKIKKLVKDVIRLVICLFVIDLLVFVTSKKTTPRN